MAIHIPFILLLFFASTALAGPADFETPVPVEIDGYEGHVMEPFLSRDGKWLFFNNRNQPEDQTDLHVATYVDDTRFRYIGSLEGANSEDLDGVPSMDRGGRFYFVSPRDYGETRITLWRGEFSDGSVQQVMQLEGEAFRNKPFGLNIDAEISADGETLYFTENRWRIFGGGVKTSNLILAHRDEAGVFRLPENARDIFKNVNTDKLEFAPAISQDQLTLYFTRADLRALRKGLVEGFGIYVATRSSVTDAFVAPEQIASIMGYVEAPTLTPDECAIYFHKQVNGIFTLRRAEKSDCL